MTKHRTYTVSFPAVVDTDGSTEECLLLKISVGITIEDAFSVNSFLYGFEQCVQYI